MAIIPDTNLPIFLQKYTVSITDGAVSWALLAANPSNTPQARVWSFQLNGTLSYTTRDTYIIEYNLDKVETGGYMISFEGTPIGSCIISNKTFVVSQKNLRFTYEDTPTRKRILLYLDANIGPPIKKGKTKPFLLNFYLNDTTTPQNTWNIYITYGTSQNTGLYYWDGTKTLSISELPLNTTSVSIDLAGCPDSTTTTFELNGSAPSVYSGYTCNGRSITPGNTYLCSNL